jgi:uncharacterized protein (TIGR03437 family)
VRVEYFDRASNVITVPVLGAVPGVFTVDGLGNSTAAAVQQDGVVSVWATGLGLTSPAAPDGSIYTPPLPRLLAPVTVFVDGEPARVDYAGPAPGMVAGAMQINFALPRGLPRAASGVRRVVVRTGNTPAASVFLVSE